jgi:MOSC domain-containing protein YiiM
MTRLISVNIGVAQLLLIREKSGPARGVQTAIRKTPVSELAQPDSIRVGVLGLENDEQVDLSVHGGRDKAVYAFCAEHYDGWRERLSREGGAADRLDRFGAFGENLTVEGFDESTVYIGDLWHVGQTILRVTEPRSPCYKFTALMRAPLAARWMFETHQSGWYLSVVQSGVIHAGCAVRVEPGPRDTSVQSALDLKKRPRDL